MGDEVQWGVWRSDGQWTLQRGTREPWVAADEEDAKWTAVEMTDFAKQTGADELTYEARPLPATGGP